LLVFLLSRHPRSSTLFPYTTLFRSEPRLQRSVRTRPVVVLTGARQTGKTSTLLRLFPKYGFVSLDLPTEAEQAEKEPQNFLGRQDRKSTRLNSSHDQISYAVFCLKK